MKLLLRLLLFSFLISHHSLPAQNGDFKQKKERKKLWKKWRKNRQSYNPYLDRKNKNKPSVQLARENRKEIKRQNRIAKKQMRRSKRSTGRKRGR